MFYEFIKDIANKVFSNLGTGHSEYIYDRAMEIELRKYNISYESEKRCVINYISDGINYSIGEERIDLYLYPSNDIIHHKIIIELKSTVNPPKENEIAQLYKYKRELNKIGENPIYGYIINFPQPTPKGSKESVDILEINLSNTNDDNSTHITSS